MRAPKLWKVEAQMGDFLPPIISVARSLISPAALLVKVSSRML
jgi:hypothetical protein